MRPCFLVMILGAALTIGCGSSSGSPLAPSLAADPLAPTSPLPPIPPSPSQTVASVVIQDAFAIGSRPWTCGTGGCVPGETYVYEVRFSVAETGGRSGATIKEVKVINPAAAGGTFAQLTSESCWRDELWVAPGGTLDTFYTDEGSRWLGYCYVGIDAPPAISMLQLQIFFVDDHRNHGSALATVSKFR